MSFNYWKIYSKNIFFILIFLSVTNNEYIWNNKWTHLMKIIIKIQHGGVFISTYQFDMGKMRSFLWSQPTLEPVTVLNQSRRPQTVNHRWCQWYWTPLLVNLSLALTCGSALSISMTLLCVQEFQSLRHCEGASKSALCLLGPCVHLFMPRISIHC